MNHNYLISEWTEKDSEYIFGVVGNFVLEINSMDQMVCLVC